MLKKIRKQNVLLEIILLIYNKEDDNYRIQNISNCLKKIYNSYFKDFGLTILNNGTGKQTQKIINYYLSNNNNITYIESNKNLGIVNGRNKAYEIIDNFLDYKYIFIMDDDQFLHKNTLEKYINNMYRWDIIGTEGWILEEKSFLPLKRNRNKEGFHYVGCGGAIIKKYVIDDIGLYDNNFSPMYFEDPDFCIRACHLRDYKMACDLDSKIIHNSVNTLKGDKKIFFKKSMQYFQQKWNTIKLKKFYNYI